MDTSKKRSMAEMLLGSEYSMDVTFLVGDKKTPVKAHRTVLSACSDVFRSMLYTSHMAETATPTTVPLPDDSPETMTEFVSCCYLSSIPPQTDWKLALRILKLADKYVVLMLQPEFGRYFSKVTTVDNCSEILAEVPVPYGEVVYQRAYATLIGTAAIERNGALNMLKQDCALKTIENVREGLNPDLTMRRLIEYAVHNSAQNDPAVKTMAAKILSKCKITAISKHNITALAKTGIVDANMLLEKTLAFLPAKVSTTPTIYNDKDRIVMKIFGSGSNEVASEIVTFNSTGTWNMPEFSLIADGKKWEGVARYWAIKVTNPRLFFVDYDNLLRNKFCFKHRTFHSPVKVIEGTARLEGRCSASDSFIAEGRCNGVPVFEYLATKKPECELADNEDC